MNPLHDHSEPPVLPPDLSHLDRSLAEMASREQLPSGLTERVYRASVASLPQPQLRLRGRAATVPTHRPHWVHRTAWGQLAMAASIGLAFVLGAWFMAQQPGSVEHGAMIAHQDGPAMTTTRVSYERPVVLSRDAEWELFDSTLNGESFAHLFETRDLSYSEAHSDLTRLLDDLEL